MENKFLKNRERKFLLVFFILIIFLGIFFSTRPFTVQAQTADQAYAMPTKSAGGQDICSWGSWVKNFPKCILLSLNVFAGYLLGASTTLFQQMIDVRNFNQVVAHPTIYQIWEKVRDLLNIGFILVLLFSAFCTIFQVEKYSYKKILLRLIIMALLVNFSFPITRFIIDLANSLMYTLIQLLFPARNGVDIFAGFAKNSNLTKGLSPDQSTYSGLLASVIFTFILSVSLLAVGVLLVIRLVALAILIIFSPVAYVGSILPGAGEGLAGKWWDNLFRYAFFGPIMIFMIYVSSEFMKLEQSYMKNWSNVAGQQAQDANVVAAIAFSFIPVVLLWMSMGIAQQMSIEGAGTVVGTSRKFMGWAGTKVSGVGFARDTFKAYKARREQAKTDKWSYRLGTRLGSEQDAMRAGIAGGYAGKQAGLRYQQDLNAKAANAAKQHDTQNMTKDELEKLAHSGDKFEKAAALLELAARGQANLLDENGKLKYDHLGSMGEMFGTESQLFKQMQNKVATYNPSAAFSHIVDSDERKKRIAEHIKSNKFEQSKLNSDAFTPEALDIMLKEQVINGDEIEKHRKKSDKHAKNIKTALTSIIGGYGDETKDLDQNVQRIYLQQHGELSSVAESNYAMQDKVFRGGDKDTFKRMTADQVKKHEVSMAMNMNAGQFKNIVQSMQHNAARKALIDYIRANASTFTPGSNEQVLNTIVERDPYLQSI